MRENLYESQKATAKSNLYKFIETSDFPGDKHIALLLIQAIRFIEQAPALFHPEFTLDDDFDLCLDWTKDKYNSFSLSIDKEGLCAYAYIKQYGDFFHDNRDRKGNGKFKIGSSELEDFKSSLSIIMSDIFHE